MDEKHGVLSCMDYRLTDYLQGKYGDAAVMIRNAGANVKTAEGSIKKAIDDGVTRWVVAVHDDCGAMGASLQYIDGKAVFGDSITDALISQFNNGKIREELDNAGSERRLRLERLNEEVQRSALSRLSREVKITSEFIHAGSHKGEGEHVLLLLESPTTQYSDIITRARTKPEDRVYIIQGSDLLGMRADIELAVSILHTTPIKAVSTSISENARLLGDITRLVKEQYIAATKSGISLVKYDAQKAKTR